MKKTAICVSVIGALAVFTVAFFGAEIFLPAGWYYVPDTANRIAWILCMIWIAVISVAIWYFSGALKKKVEHGYEKGILSVVSFFICVCTALFLMVHCWSYCVGHQERVERYDQHLALYVKNTFVRTEFREPCYRYEENWLLMRELTDEELDSAILQYGDPEDYYN